MIESLHIKNFQSHKDSLLEFAPGVNAIVGPTDSGKTAILRALNVVVFNRPSGNSFRSHWGGDTVIDLTTTEPFSIVREFKGKTGNLYRYVDAYGKEYEYRAFGRDVPEEVANLLNLGEINFQRQHDRHFLLSESPGEVARRLNAVASLDLVDKALSAINGMVREASGQVQGREQHIEVLKEQIQEFDGLPEVAESLAEAEELDKGIACNQEKAQTIRSLSLRIAQIKVDSVANKAIAELAPALEVLAEMKATIAEGRSAIANLKWLLEAIRNEKKKQQQLKARITSAEDDLHEIMPEECPLCGQQVPS